MGALPAAELAARLRAASGDAIELTALAQSVYAAVEPSVPFDFACFATTDPATGLVTWASKTRSLGVGDEEFAAAEYGGADVNTFAEIAQRSRPVGVLSVDTDGQLDTCRRHRDFLFPRFGFTDELRLVFRSRGASWGAMALYRGTGEPAFTQTDADLLAPISEPVAHAIQRSLFTLESPAQAGSAAEAGGPAVLIVDAADRVAQLTPAARHAIDELGGWDHGSLPANVLVVVASTRRSSEHVETHVQGRSGTWFSLRAAALAGPVERDDVVVSIERTPRATLSRLALAAHGLTAREEDVALLVLQGASTRAIAAALYLSPHTVQDHLKQIFAKLGVTSRRELTARLVLT